MKTHKVQINQSLIDIAIQYAGTPDAVFELLKANGLDLKAIEVGTELQIPDFQVRNDKILEYFQANGYQVATANGVVCEDLSPWILATGYWRDQGIWIDSEYWKDY